MRVYEQNRISGYSRDIWGHSMSRLGRAPHDGMKMSDCEDCHRRTMLRWAASVVISEGAMMKFTRRDLLMGAPEPPAGRAYSGPVEVVE